MSRPQKPVFDVWVCQGRLCTSAQSDTLFHHAEQQLGQTQNDRVRLLRGGCYGHCELGPNVIVRRYDTPEALPSENDDKLSLTHAKNETLYCQVNETTLVQILGAHLEDDEIFVEQTYERVIEQFDKESLTVKRIHQLRERKRSSANKTN